MSRELLKEIFEWHNSKNSTYDHFEYLMDAVEAELAKPGPEPVAWALFSKELMPTGAAYAIRRVEIQLAQIESDLDIQDAEIRPLFLKGDLLASNKSALNEQFRQVIEMKGLDTRALLEDVLGTLKYILNRNEIRADIIKKDIFNIEIALSKPTPTDQVVELENKLANLQCSANDAAKYIRELKNESKAWKTLYHDECEAYDAKIQSLELKIESLTDANIDRVLTMTDDQITALTVMDGHNPHDVAKIGRHAAETAILKSKIKSLEYQLKQLSSIHSATVNALADERNSKVLGNAQ
jgi:chromosome segregation ATPase